MLEARILIPLILLLLIKTIRVKFAPNVEPILVRKPWMSESIVVSRAGTPLIALAAAAQVIRDRGILAVGQPVSKTASGGVLSGIDSNIGLESSL